MKDAIRTCAPVYNTHRMVTDYLNTMYRDVEPTTSEFKPTHRWELPFNPSIIEATYRVGVDEPIHGMLGYASIPIDMS